MHLEFFEVAEVSSVLVKVTLDNGTVLRMEDDSVATRTSGCQVAAVIGMCSGPFLFVCLILVLSPPAREHALVFLLFGGVFSLVWTGMLRLLAMWAGGMWRFLRRFEIDRPAGTWTAVEATSLGIGGRTSTGELRELQSIRLDAPEGLPHYPGAGLPARLRIEETNRRSHAFLLQLEGIDKGRGLGLLQERLSVASGATSRPSPVAVPDKALDEPMGAGEGTAETPAPKLPGGYVAVAWSVGREIRLFRPRRQLASWYLRLVFCVFVVGTVLGLIVTLFGHSVSGTATESDRSDQFWQLVLFLAVLAGIHLWWKVWSMPRLTVIDWGMRVLRVQRAVRDYVVPLADIRAIEVQLVKTWRVKARTIRDSFSRKPRTRVQPARAYRCAIRANHVVGGRTRSVPLLETDACIDDEHRPVTEALPLAGELARALRVPLETPGLAQATER